MKIVTIVGARPQFIKAAPLSRALRTAGRQRLMCGEDARKLFLQGGKRFKIPSCGACQ